MFRRAADWVSRNIFSKVQVMLVTALIVLIGLTAYLIKQNQEVAASLKASQAAVGELQTTFEGYRTQQEEIVSGLAVLNETQGQILVEQQATREVIYGAAEDDNRSHDPFWDSVFDSMRDPTEDDRD